MHQDIGHRRYFAHGALTPSDLGVPSEIGPPISREIGDIAQKGVSHEIGSQPILPQISLGKENL